MGLDSRNRANAESFLRGVTPLEGAYPNASFSYIALRARDQFRIHCARLFLRGGSAPPQPSLFQSENVRGGLLPLKDLQLNIRQFLEAVVTGKVATPHGELSFPDPSARWHAA